MLLRRISFKIAEWAWKKAMAENPAIELAVNTYRGEMRTTSLESSDTFYMESSMSSLADHP